MTDAPSPDPTGPATKRMMGVDPDAHGQAALLLVESPLHALRERGVLSIDDILGVTASACEVKQVIADEGGETNETARHSLELIARIASSLQFDLPDGDRRPSGDEG